VERCSAVKTQTGKKLHPGNAAVSIPASSGSLATAGANSTGEITKSRF